MSDKNEEFKQRILEVSKEDFILDVDGFYYYYPTKCGYLTPHHLRTIADELDRINKPWNDQINNYLENNNVR